MLEAMTCSSSSPVPRRVRSDAIRVNELRRGRIAVMTSRVEGDPVADRREVDVGERREAERPRHRGRPVARAVADDRGLAVDGDDPAGPESLGRERREGLRPAGVPAEGTQARPRRSSSQPTRFSLPVRLA